MSKEAALQMLGVESQPTPSLITGEQPKPESQDVKVEAPADLDSARFAALARKEAEFVKRQQAFKTDLDKFGAERTQVQDILKKRDQFEETRKQNPIEALKLIGFSETEIMNFLAAQEKPELTPEEQAKEIATKTAQEILAADKKAQLEAQEKAQIAQDESTITEFKKGMGSLVGADPEKYEYCSYYGENALEIAYSFIEQAFKDSNGEDCPTAQEAIEATEQFYEEKDKEMTAKIKKRSLKMEGETSPEVQVTPERTRTVTTPAGHTPVAPAIQKIRTLSNQAGATSAGMARKIHETTDQKKARMKEELRSQEGWQKYMRTR